ncbi:MAG: hypothetical protein WBO09_15505 [Methylocystis silviterrae]|uniref:hypothetical protein n=1 Tax=Methylocystis silviterrae TaxID=2743612 RepID=UPI003C7217BE
MRAPGPWIIGDLQQRRNAARSRVIYDVTRIVTRALNTAPNGIDRVDFALARHCLAHGEVGEAIDYIDPLDELGWLQAVRDYATPQSLRRRMALARLGRRDAAQCFFLQRLTTIIAQL